MTAKTHPELDATRLLDAEGIQKYQNIHGACQWMITLGRMDIQFSISSLGRFLAAPREGHMDMAEQILGYLKKYLKKGITVNPDDPKFNEEEHKKLSWSKVLVINAITFVKNWTLSFQIPS